MAGIATRQPHDMVFGPSPLSERTLVTEFDKDSSAGAYRWLPLSPAVVIRLTSTYLGLPPAVTLRAADAIHLACAAEAGFTKVHSNDSRLLAAAAHFGIKGENII